MAQNCFVESGARGWNFCLPVNVVFGCGRVAEVGAVSKPYGTKALVVTGRSSAKKSGLLDRVRSSLAEAGIESVVFDRVQQNPLTTTAEEGAAVAKAERCGLVVAVGGGSVIDCAKGIAFLAVNDGDISDYIFARRTSDGTGTEGNGFAVLTNPANGDKKSLRCPAILPKAAIVDPDCMMTMPAHVLASVGFDALCHCMEAYTAVSAQPFTDALAVYAIALLAQHLPRLYRHVAGANGAGAASASGGRTAGADSAAAAANAGATSADDDGWTLRAAWEAVSAAATIGGMCIGVCGVTLSHGMEHPASGLRDIVHGQGLAALTPAVTAFFAEKLEKAGGSAATDARVRIAAHKFAHISQLLGGAGLSDCAERIRALLSALRLTPTLGALGITERDIPWMVENCKKVSAGNLANTPVPVSDAELFALYAAAIGGTGSPC